MQYAVWKPVQTVFVLFLETPNLGTSSPSIGFLLVNYLQKVGGIRHFLLAAKWGQSC